MRYVMVHGMTIIEWKRLTILGKRIVLYLDIKESKYVITYMLKVTQKISLDLT